MKTYILPIITLVLSLTAAGYADRTMGRTEALGILQKLAATPTSTWIAAGTIEARHEESGAAKTTDSAEIDAAIQQAISDYQGNPNKFELTPELQKMVLEAIPFNVRYQMSNEYSMTSSVTVKYDGNKFYWSIKVGSRTDSVQLPSELKGNYEARRFDLSWNGNRIFAWDGQKYTLYTVSANQAIVDTAGTLPHSVNGPLTAGIIPWGYGRLTSSSLNSAAISAAEVTRDSKTQVEMTVQPSDGSTMTFTLDPAKDNAVTAYTWRGNLNKTTSNYYSGHQKIGGKWVPMTILVEQHDFETGRLLKSDKWDFTRVDATTPHDFGVAFNSGARVEHRSPVSDKPAVYNYSNAVNTDRLLAEQVAFNIAKETSAQNCATAALKYVASQFGKAISDKDLAKLVGPDGKTSLDVLKRAAQGLGLNARAVKTDLATLRTLNDCKAILYIPGKNHFLVLDSINGAEAWLVDLSESRFYYRANADLLPMDWSDGVALLLSTRPIEGSFHDIDSSLLATIAAGQSNWDCTWMVQGGGAVTCLYFDPPIGCDGIFMIYFERWRCQQTRYVATCSEEQLVYRIDMVCIQDAFQQYHCFTSGDWIYSYGPACQ